MEHGDVRTCKVQYKENSCAKENEKIRLKSEQIGDRAGSRLRPMDPTDYF